VIESYDGLLRTVHPRTFIHPLAVLSGEVIVGADASIWPHATLRGDEGRIELGARSNIQDGCTLHCMAGLSTTWVGEQVTVGHNATIHGARIGNNCLIGMGSILLDNVELGEWCFVGAGSLITQGLVIPPGSLVWGSPAKVVRPINEKERGAIDFGWRRYVEQLHLYRQAHGMEPVPSED